MPNSTTPINTQPLRTLHQAAHRLARASSHAAPFSLVLMSDQKRLPDLASLIPCLPSTCAIIFRDYFAPKRDELAKRLSTLAHHHGLAFLVAGDVHLARRVHADGLHLPSHLLRHPGLWQHYPGIITAACHTRTELNLARHYRVDMALISPVWPTRSHPGMSTLGQAGFTALSREAGLPVMALGGMEPENARRLQNRHCVGVAAISTFARSYR